MTDYSDKLVLVADDEPGMVAMVGGYLRGKGFQVIEASDGAQAWDLAHERLPDLVILDVMMPGMSGWEVCRKIKEAVSLHHTGVIMLTGIGENLNEMTSPLYGADAYLDKPFEFDDLSAKIDETLNIHSGGGSPAETDDEPRKPVKKRPKKASPNQGSLFVDDPEETQGTTGAAKVKKAAKKAVKAAKKAAKKAKPAVKKAAKKVAKAAKKAAKKIAKAAKEATNGKPAAKKAAKKVAKAAKKAAKKKVAKAAKKATKSKPAAKKAAKKVAKAAKKAAKKVAKAAKKATKSKPAAKKVAKAAKKTAAKQAKPAASKAAKKAKPAAKKVAKAAKKTAAKQAPGKSKPAAGKVAKKASKPAAGKNGAKAAKKGKSAKKK